MTGQPILPRATDLSGLQIVPLKDVVLTQGVARQLDFTLSDMYDKIQPQESIYIDNPHDAVISVLAPRSGQVIKAPPRSIGWYPLILPAPVQFAITYTPARSTQTTLTIQIAFCNRTLVMEPYSLVAPGSSPFSSSLTGAVINASAAGNNTIVAAAAGEMTRVHRMYFTVSAPTQIIILRGATALTGAMETPAGMFLDYSEIPWYVTDANEAFIIYSSIAVNIAGRIEYIRGA